MQWVAMLCCLTKQSEASAQTRLVFVCLRWRFTIDTRISFSIHVSVQFFLSSSNLPRNARYEPCIYFQHFSPAPSNCNSSVFYVTYRLTIVFLLHSHKLTIFMFFFVRENDLKRLLSITLGACYWQCVVEEQTELTLLDEVKCRWLRHTRRDRFLELVIRLEEDCLNSV